MNRDLRLFLTGQVTSAFGSAFTLVAVPLIAVRHLGASPAQVGGLVAAASLPLVLFGLLVAAWVDRLPRRRPCLIACELLAAAAIACVVLALVADLLTVWGLIAFVVVLGLLNAVVESAYFVHLRALVSDRGLVRARAVLQGGEQVGDVLGRLLAGPAIVLGTVVPLVVDCVSYLLSALCLILIRQPEPRRRAAHSGRVSRRELGEGFAALRSEPFLRHVAPFIVGRQLVNGMVLTALPLFLLTVLDVPTSWYGALFVFAGVAAFAGSAVSARLAVRVDARALTVLGFVGASVTTLLLPCSGGPLPLAAAIASLGIGLPYLFGAIANVGLTAVLTASVPEEKLGRTGASLQLVAAASLAAGSLLGGLLAQQVGIRPTLWLAAASSVAIIAALRPVLRTAARQPAASSEYASTPSRPAAAARQSA